MTLGRLHLWSVYLFTVSLPFHSADIGIWPVRITWLVGSLCVVLGLCRLALGSACISKSVTQKATTVFFIFISSVSLLKVYGLGSARLLHFFTSWVQIAFGILVSWSIYNAVDTRRKVRRVVRVLITAAIAVALYGIYQSIAFNVFTSLPWFNFRPLEGRALGFFVGSYERAFSVFSEPSYFGTFLVPPCLYLMGSGIWSKRAMGTWRIAGLCILMVGVYLSQSLSAYIGLVVSIIVLHVMSLMSALSRGYFSRRALIHGAMLLCLVCVVGLVVFSSDVVASGLVRVDRLLAAVLGDDGVTVDGSTHARLSAFFFALKVWSNNPFFGVGLNNLGAVTGLHDVFGIRVNTVSSSGHNMWVQLLAETGVVGFTCIATAFTSLFVKLKGLTAPVYNSNNDSHALIALLVAVVSVSFFSRPIYHPLYWFYIGLTMSAVRVR